MAGEPRKPKVLILYSWESEAHRARVRELAIRLRDQGLEVNLDQFHDAPPDELQLVMKQYITASDFVVSVCTETYRRWFEKEHRPDEEGKGRGVRWEAQIIRTLLYNGRSPATFVPVLFPDSSPRDVPIELNGSAYYRVEDPQDFEHLLRHLRSRPRDEDQAPAGAAQVPPKAATSASAVTSHASSPGGICIDKARPFIHHLPPLNPYFTGRQEELQQIDAALRGQGIAMLSGMGGTGKTQTAGQYAHEHLGDYRYIFWMTADAPADLVTGFARLAALLELPQANTEDPVVAAEAAKRWLAGNDGWLLVLDNVDDPALPAELASWLPSGRHGHVLITSRLSSAPELGVPRPIKIQRLPNRDAYEFLTKRIGRAVAGAELEALVNLAEDLGYLPLALEQAAAYILDRDLSLADYRQSYQRGTASLRQEILDRMPPQIGERQKRPLATTWLLNIAQVEEASPAAAALLRFFAWLHPDEIPFELITRGKEHLGEEIALAITDDDDPLCVADLLAPLRRYSLVEVQRHRRTVSIHRLLQEVIQAKLDDDSRREWAQRAVGAAQAAWPTSMVESRMESQRLIDHALVLANHIDDLHLSTASSASLLGRLGYALFLQARYAEAERVSQRAVTIAGAVYGEEDVSVGWGLNTLGLVRGAMGRYAEAEIAFQRSLSIAQQQAEVDGESLAITLTNLANVYLQQAKWDQALPVFLQALRLQWGPDNPLVANTLQSLANQYFMWDSLAIAEMLYRWGMKIAERCRGAHHPMLVQGLMGLSLVYTQQDEIEQAETLLRRGLDIAERTWGPDHPISASCLTLLAGNQCAQGRYDEADRLFQRALSIVRQTLGPNHRMVGELLLQIAAAYFDQDRAPEAEPLSQRGLDVLEAALGPEHPEVTDAIEMRLEILHAMGREHEMEALRKRLRTILGENSSDDEPDGQIDLT